MNQIEPIIFLSADQRLPSSSSPHPHACPRARTLSLFSFSFFFVNFDKESITVGKLLTPPTTPTTPPPSHITSRGTLNMAPSRRATERAGQLEAPVARGRRAPPPLPSPSSTPIPLAGWVGGIWRPRQGPLWCDTQKAWSHPGWARHRRGRLGVTELEGRAGSYV